MALGGVDGLRGAGLAAGVAETARGRSAAAGGFEQVLARAIRQVENFRLEADQKVERFLAGEGEDLHTVALATQRAELAFELFVQVRNKVVQAYQEIMRMQV
jgi:flagellar hook-basal body complex protein FliE